MDIDYLLKYLIDEDKRYKEYAIPKSQDEKWQLFRSLVNMRNPKPISREFIDIQDKLLQKLITDKGITDVDDLHPIRDNIYLWRGDITTLKVGAIVNAANSGMLGCFVPCHACIDNAIHTFAGVQLRLECVDIMKKQGYPEPTGQAKITSAYNLPSKYILHTVGTIVQGNVTDKNRNELASCYKSCLELAERNKIESVAYCCISTGEFRFPNEEAAEIAVNTVIANMKNALNVKRVIFNVFNETDQTIYGRLLGANK
jgi:O-acetyl-ADP-ribose deacetylase (regulator of RNase III)